MNQEVTRFVGENRAVLAQLTRQEQQFVFHYLQGWPPEKAARAAGYAANMGRALVRKPQIADAVEQYAGKEMTEAVITREKLTQMVLESHGRALSVTEELGCVDRLARLHQLYDPKPVHPTVAIQVNAGGAGGAEAPSVRLRSVSDADLLKHSEFAVDSLDPEADELDEVATAPPKDPWVGVGGKVYEVPDEEAEERNRDDAKRRR